MLNKTNSYHVEVLPNGFDLNGLRIFCTDSNGRTKTRPLRPLIYFVFYILLGGLLCFDIREQCMEEWEDKLKELEVKGIWETVTKEKLSVDDNDKTNAFVFKLL